MVKEAKQADNIIAKEMVQQDHLKKGELIVFDRYYVDFSLRTLINSRQAYFVTRTKSNTDYVVVQQNKV